MVMNAQVNEYLSRIPHGSLDQRPLFLQISPRESMFSFVTFCPAWWSSYTKMEHLGRGHTTCESRHSRSTLASNWNIKIQMEIKVYKYMGAGRKKQTKKPFKKIGKLLEFEAVFQVKIILGKYYFLNFHCIQHKHTEKGPLSRQQGDCSQTGHTVEPASPQKKRPLPAVQKPLPLSQ